MLSVNHLQKRFGERLAVADVSFNVDRGQTVGVLGPNGAGKTTTLAMISALVRPDSGTVQLLGEVVRPDAAALKLRVGLVPQDLALYEELSAWANLELFGGLYGLTGGELRKRATAALELVNLFDRRSEHVKGFSGGMKRRLNLAGALLHDPDLILLDEPTVGVDPQSRNAIFENLEELKRRGKTLLYTTHYMEEAERLCDRIVIMDHGGVLADDTIAGLHRLLPPSHSVDLQVSTQSITPQVLAGLEAIPGIAAVTRLDDGIRLESRDFGACLASALQLLTTRELTVTAVRSAQPRLEEIFIRLTGRALRDAPGQSAT